MTDRSKSPRKRRLQLNAEEFAPPTDLHEATAEPRLDDTWVQYYGGQKQGGIKRLSSLDDETSADEISEAQRVVPLETALPADSGHLSGPQNLTTPSLVQQTPAPSQEIREASVESRPQRTLSPVKDIRREEKPDTTAPMQSRVVEEVETKSAPLVQQADDSKGISASDLSAETTRPATESDASAPSFESWSRRWSPWLKRGGSIKVCEAFYRLTHAKGSAECFTSNSEIMRLTGLSRAQCIRNIHYLIEMGFLDELNEVNNREAKGTYYRFNLVPTQLTIP